VFRHYLVHPEAETSVEAALCAGKQGAEAFWKMHDLLFERMQDWSAQQDQITVFVEYANELDLDADALAACLAAGEMSDVVQEETELGRSLGVGGTPNFRINDWIINGAVEFAEFQRVIEAALRGEPAPPTPTPAPPPFDVNPERPGYTYGGDITLGSAQAPLMVLEFIDFQSAENQEFYLAEWPDLLTNYVDPGQVRIVVKHFPADGQEAASLAAQAAECAGLQGAFWEMHDLLFEQPQQWSQASDVSVVLKGYADELDLDADAFSSCLDQGETADKVQQDVLIAQRNSLEPAPQFVVFFGNQASIVPLEDLRGVLDQLLEQL
jgi:protein-disulfide isomerase